MAAQDNIDDVLNENLRFQDEKGSFHRYRYGTAGFRMHHEKLNSVIVRVGLIACLRSQRQNGQPCGVMITASHNKGVDNGVKITDVSGEMLHPSYESIATEIANLPAAEVMDYVNAKRTELSVDASITPTVYVGYDTRAHSPGFADLLVRSVEANGGIITNFGVCTTPQLHQMVRFTYLQQEASLTAYYDMVEHCFRELTIQTTGQENYLYGELYVDCSNGVGYTAVNEMQSRLADIITIETMNIPSGGGAVNEGCGAEFVQKKKQFPANFDGQYCQNKRCASVDGDCDRLVYFTADTNQQHVLCDGDKLISLYAGWILQLLQESGLTDASFGIVQTAYANGASTAYMQNDLNLTVDCAKTGVKHLHVKAHHYDVSVYFEANGHGTILFSSEFLSTIDTHISANPENEEVLKALRTLKNISVLANQCVGDALTDMLLVEVALVAQGFSIEDWANLYADFPSKMDKIPVVDRSQWITTNAERTCLKPEGVQDMINSIVDGVADSRCFVRPSGTENVVRVFAEATTQEDADNIAAQVCDYISSLL